jgi:hypothetical protein
MPEASLRVLLKVKARRDSSPAVVPDPSIPPAPMPAVSPVLADPVVQAAVPASERVQASAVLRVQADLAVRGPDSGVPPVLLRPLEKLRARSEPATLEAAAGASNIQRRRKAR